MNDEAEESQRSLAKVVGRNCKDIREAAGLKKDELARHARDVGLRWDSSKVGRFESGDVAPTFATVLAVTLALSRALADAARRGASIDRSDIGLADLVVSDDWVILTADIAGVQPRGQVLADVCRGLPWPDEPADLYTAEQLDLRHTYDKIVTPALADISKSQEKALAAALLSAVMRRSGLAEERLAKRLNISADRLAVLSAELWQKTFSGERDLRAGPDANAQKRGQVARQLQAELERALRDGR